MRLLDLYCGAGGAATGYHRAGFTEIVGVDIQDMSRHYPFTFVRGDALWYLQSYGHEFDAIHASPPCQRFSAMSQCRPGLNANYPDAIASMRHSCTVLGKPFVLENVIGAPLENPILLCGAMFGLALYRHRLFESTVPLVAPSHPVHSIPASRAGHWKLGTIMSVAGHVSPMSEARRAMDIDWMTRDQLAEAIPPAYTKYIGRQIIAFLQQRRSDPTAA